MAIQFQCAFCKQPIEIDDEFASSAVGCPYCKKTVTAPAGSTLDTPPHIPTASAAGNPSPDAEAVGGGARATPAASPNTIAIVAFALACTVLVALFVTGAILSAHTLELKDLAEKLEGAGTDFKSQLDAMNAFLSDRGGVPPTWLIVAVFLQLATWMVWLAALVCALIGIRRIARRRFAVAALGICGGFLVLNCANVFM